MRRTSREEQLSRQGATRGLGTKKQVCVARLSYINSGVAKGTRLVTCLTRQPFRACMIEYIGIPSTGGVDLSSGMAYSQRYIAENQSAEVSRWVSLVKTDTILGGKY